jgi:hypothetical protein
VGINAATPGDLQLSVLADGKLMWMIYYPSKASSVKIANGWHVLTSTKALEQGRWYDVTVGYGTRGLRIRLDGNLVGQVGAVLPLAGDPIWVGDFPGDDGWGAGYNIHPSLTGQVKGLAVEQ